MDYNISIWFAILKWHRKEGIPTMQGEESHEISYELCHLYALIGSIASTSSHIENSIDVTLWSLAGVDAQVGACFTAQIQSPLYRLNRNFRLAITTNWQKSQKN